MYVPFSSSKVQENDLQGLISWTKPQVQARSHPNLLASIVWLNNLYHAAQNDSEEKNEQLANTMKGVDLSTPLSYADRFRIRKPGYEWDFHPPHVDGAFLLVSPIIHEILCIIRRNDGEMGRPIFQEMF